MITTNRVRPSELLLERIARADPARQAITDLSANGVYALTFEELNRLSDRAAQGLIELGVREGENVAYLLPNGWEFAALTLAVWKIGAVACPMLPALREREIPFIMEKSQSRILVIPAGYRGFRYGPLIDGIRDRMPGMKFSVTVDSRDPSDVRSCLGGLAAKEPDLEEIRRRRPGPDAPAQLLFTSGTTGEPKGVIHSHGSLGQALDAHVRTLGLTDEDTIWVPSPMAHQTGFLYGMSLAMFLGAPQVVQAEWSVETARAAIERHGATFVQAAMPFLADLTRADRPPQGLRAFIATGAPVPRKLAQEAGRRLSCKVAGGWGSTETCMISVGSVTDDAEASWNSDGKVMPGREMKVTGEDGRTLPPGKEGLFKVKTPAMFLGYLHHPEWYEAAIDAEGFFNTGDLAVIDEEGNLRLTGRVKDVINRGGVKVPVAEIENLLYQMEELRDAAIVGMPDPRLGERICAYVSLKEPGRSLTLEDVTAFLKAQGLTKIYWPERLEVIDEMPRTPTGKIQKYVLRQWIEKMGTR
ncbi:AMP-binding protein [Cohnella caldifontis]|uniref:AMP-binding protein n=1 Tax=Cohnella caldifontis TaxID=3027471 RepID=UPI0023ED1BB5|nr:AMP-binding protein [Cohnella sp. YIM B05605]